MVSRRHQAGAGSENGVCAPLRELAEERWNIPLAGWWLWRGDIDHLVQARSGVGYARSRRFDEPHLVQAGDTARAVLRVGRRGRSRVPARIGDRRPALS
jgi:hypothetical protein